PWPKAYGGDLVAQAAVAAQRTVGDGKALHSMHSYFMRPADIGAEVRYEVELLRDGRGYSTRQVRAFSRGKAVYACLASFAAGETGGEYAAEFPAGIPAPETLPTSAQYLAERSGGSMTAESKAYWSGGRGFDMRHVPCPLYLTVDGATRPQQAVWIRPFDALRPVDGLTSAQRDAAALAYVCDYTILEPVLRVLGLPWADEGLITASLDHAMWFHRPGSVDRWLLYAQQAVAAGRGRGLATGRFFAPDGAHLATVVQQGMIRTVSGGQP
ncbi:MAG TPA: acyl-CoA thioesterase domain-containing protein, partial [Trebonia sp.]